MTSFDNETGFGWRAGYLNVPERERWELVVLKRLLVLDLSLCLGSQRPFRDGKKGRGNGRNKITGDKLLASNSHKWPFAETGNFAQNGEGSAEIMILRRATFTS